MSNRWIVSGGGRVQMLRGGGRSTMVEGVGALCVGRDELFAASDRDNAIWRLDIRTFMPTALYVGGPGMCAMRLSKDGKRLYVLCSDADSLLMIDVERGEPMLLNRVGVGPADMDVSPDGKTIAVAGGGCGKAVLLCAQSLNVLRTFDAPGVVQSVALGEGVLYALSVTETLDTSCTAYLSSGERYVLDLPGMPGVVRVIDGLPVAATQERIHVLSQDGKRVVYSGGAPGRASKMLKTEEGILLLDALSERLYLCRKDGRWEMIAEGVRDIAKGLCGDGAIADPK